MRESLLQSKQELERMGQEGSKWVEKYDILLSQLGAEQALSEEDHQENYQELVATSGQQSLSGMEFYEQELSRLYPTKTKPMSERNVKILGTLFRLGQMNPYAWTMPQEPVGIAYTAEEILTKKIASRALPTGQEKSVIRSIRKQNETEEERKLTASSQPEQLSEAAPAVSFPSSVSPDQKVAMEALVPKATHIEELSKNGVNTAFKMKDQEEKSYFFKTFTKEDETHFLSDDSIGLVRHFSSKHEAASSTLANYITGGLVPEGQAYEDSILYPLENLDLKETKRVFTHTYPNYGFENVYGRLNPGQKRDLFLNMLADMALMNPDTHSGQFGINTAGRLIGFDKGRSYFDVFKSKDLQAVSMPQDFLRQSKIYKDFTEELKKHPEDLKAVLEDAQVQDALSRIQSLSLDSEQASVKQLQTPLFAFIDHRSGKDVALQEKLRADYFKMLESIPRVLSSQLGIEESRLAGRVQTEVQMGSWGNEMKAATFDPKRHPFKIVSALEQGFPRGRRVSDLVRTAGGIAGINGGFFSEGRGAQSGAGWFASKVVQKLGQVSSSVGSAAGAVLGENEAFPIAILKSGSRLQSDTNDYIPALGWIEDGSQIAVGEVKVNWNARLGTGPADIRLSRHSDINWEVSRARIYYRQGNQVKAVNLERNQVLSVEAVPDADRNQPNGYWLESPSEKTIAEFETLKPGDAVSYDYAFEAKDPKQTAQFEQMPNILSGGQILMSEGKMDPRAHTSYLGRGAFDFIGNAVCIHRDGRISFVIRPNDISIERFVSELEKHGVDLAISFDGGGSPTLIGKNPTGEQLVQGYDRVVSDVIIAMLQKQALLSDHLAKQDGPMFTALKNKDVQEVKRLLEAKPGRVQSRNRSKQNVLQVYLLQQQENKQAVDSKMVELLVSKMKPKLLESADQFGETVVHTALRMGQTELARQIVDKLGENSSIWTQKGRRGQRIFEISETLQVPERMRVIVTCECIISSIPEYREPARKQVEDWIEQGQHLEQIIHVAQQWINDDKENMDVGFKLLSQLVKRGHGYEAARQAAQKGMADVDVWNRHSALELFSELVKRGQGYEAARQAAEKGMTDLNPNIRHSALELFSMLFEQKQGYEAARQAAEKGMTDPRWEIRNSALKLFSMLFEQKQGYEAARQAAEKGMTDLSPNIRHSALELFVELVKRGHGYEAARQAAEKGMTDPNWDIRHSALQIFVELVKRGQGYEAAWQAAEKGMADPRWEIRHSALKLLSEPVKQGQGYEAARQAAEKGMTDPDWEIRHSALKLLSELVERGHGYEAARQAAEKGITDQRLDICNLALELFVKLVDKNEGIEQIQEIIDSNSGYRFWLAVLRKAELKKWVIDRLKDILKEAKKK